MRGVSKCFVRQHDAVGKSDQCRLSNLKLQPLYEALEAMTLVATSQKFSKEATLTPMVTGIFRQISYVSLEMRPYVTFLHLGYPWVSLGQVEMLAFNLKLFGC